MEGSDAEGFGWELVDYQDSGDCGAVGGAGQGDDVGGGLRDRLAGGESGGWGEEGSHQRWDELA